MRQNWEGTGVPQIVSADFITHYPYGSLCEKHYTVNRNWMRQVQHSHSSSPATIIRRPSSPNCPVTHSSSFKGRSSCIFFTERALLNLLLMFNIHSEPVVFTCRKKHTVEFMHQNGRLISVQRKPSHWKSNFHWKVMLFVSLFCPKTTASKVKSRANELVCSEPHGPSVRWSNLTNFNICQWGNRTSQPN